MKTMKIICFFKQFCLLSIFLTVSTVVIFAQNAAPVPKEVAAIVGNYTGAWTSYALDASGAVVKQAEWTDAMKAENPTVEKGRAFVSTVDEMTFAGGKIPPMKIPGKEGYLLNLDGGLGNYFVETYGQIYKMQKLAENVFAYTVAAAPPELGRLGAVKIKSAQHVLIKIVTNEAGRETHNISRITTVIWQDATGTEKTTQFVSLQGRHQRDPTESK